VTGERVEAENAVDVVEVVELGVKMFIVPG